MSADRLVNLYNLMILVHNVQLGSLDKQVGFEDADRTLDGLTRALSPSIRVPTKLIESALWSCNLLSERNRFWHPKGLSFDQFKNLMQHKDVFNTDYNCFE